MAGISTHAPLAGRDDHTLNRLACDDPISTHAPLAGRDSVRPGGKVAMFLFQPTRPLRGATAKEYKSLCTFLR